VEEDDEVFDTTDTTDGGTDNPINDDIFGDNCIEGMNDLNVTLEVKPDATYDDTFTLMALDLLVEGADVTVKIVVTPEDGNPQTFTVSI
jgi:hypothetical protein